MVDKVYEYIIDFVIAILIILASVFIYFGLRTETVIKSIDKLSAQNFMENAKRNGYFTVNDYEDLIRKLSMTGELYDISLEHGYTVHEPEYRFRTLQEILDAQKAAYTGTNLYHYRDVITEKPVVNDPVNNGTLNTETNESVLAAAVNTPASPSHVHTADCYGGGHIPVYGSLDLTKVPVYITRSKEQIQGWHEYDVYRICCAVCGDIIFEIKMPNFTSSNNSIIGSITYYTLENGNKVQHTYNYSTGYFDYSSYPHQIVSTLLKLLTDNYGASSNGYVSHDFNWPYSYIPCCDANGNQADIAFPGCSNVYKHPNPDACYPVGHKGKVVVQVYENYDTTTQSMSLFILEKCADCGRTIFSLSLSDRRGFQVSAYAEGIHTSIYKYSTNGSYSIDGYSASMIAMGAYGQEGYCYYLGVFVDQISELYQDLYYNTIASLPGYSLSGLLNFTTPPIDNPFPKLPFKIRLGDLSPITWVPNQGCGYCEPYGTTYTCGPGHHPMCDQIVASITPTHPVQTVATGDPLITTVIATYLDDSTKTVVATTGFSTLTIGQKQNAELTYTYIIDGVSYQKKCNAIINVVPRTKVCARGHTYNLNADGSDPGCPYCRAWVDKMTFIYPAVPSMTITIGSTLQENGVKILVTYLDGHTEIITTGYEDNLDMSYLGTMTVTVGYKGATAQLEVTNVCKKMTCPICVRTYDLYPDGSDPGCPHCLARIPIFTGNVMRYGDIENTDRILEVLYKDSRYEFCPGDTFAIHIQNKTETPARKILHKIYPSLSDQWFMFQMNEKILTQ